MSRNVKISTAQGIICSQIDFGSLPRHSQQGKEKSEGGRVKIIEHKARDVKSGETILDRSTRFIIKEVRVSAEHGLIAFVDMEGVWHGAYHPDEYLGLGE